MPVFGIGEVAAKMGIAPSAIRYYERVGLLPPPQRMGGKRRYDEGVLQKINLIRLAQNAGLRIAEIQALLHDFPVNTPPSERWKALAGQKIEELDSLIGRVQAMRALLLQTLDCTCQTLEGCATPDSNIQMGKNGVESSCGLT